MTTRRFLILAPLLLCLFLLQSYFWVPTYEQQNRGNPQRRFAYINGSIGDATILNPILSADASSSEIESVVFEGRIDRDRDLNFRGRVAKTWKIYEEAFFYVHPTSRFPKKGIAGAAVIVERLRAARSSGRGLPPELRRTLGNISGISVLASRNYTLTRHIRPAGTGKKPVRVKVRVRAPARIKLVLKRVDPELFGHLALLLGRDYFSGFRGQQFLTVEPAVTNDTLKSLAAEVLPAAEHNPVIEFHLRPGVRFHDGHPLSAEDVKFTYEALMNPKNLSPRTSDFEPVKRVQVVDPLTVRVVYKRLYSPALGTWSMGILPKHLLDAEALRREAVARGEDPAKFTLRQSAFNRHPVGCGPFVFRRWKSDQYIELERFADYWEGAPNFHKYGFRVIPDLLTQEMEFYAGTLDSYAVQPHQVRRLKNDPRFQTFSGTSFGYTYIGYNLRRKPFDDPRVRRALGMAIDVDRIIKYVLYNQAERITGPFVKQTDYYNHDIQPLPYDPAGALRLLAAAGWRPNAQGWLEKDGRRLQFTLITNSGNDIRKAILAIVQDAWRQIGVDVRTDLLEWSVFIQQRVNKLDFDALVLGWSMGIEPDLYQIWHSSQTGPNQLNFVGFRNRQADDLIVKIRREYDHQKQAAYCHRLHAIIAAEQPYTFLFVRKWTALLDRRIVVREVDASGKVVYKKITPTKTGNYMFDFNKWVKLAEAPALTP